MPFWITWFLIGAFVTTTAAYNVHNSSVAALKTPPSVEQQLGEDTGNHAN